MKNNPNFTNKEKIEGYVYGIGSSFNVLSVRETKEKPDRPVTKYIAGDLDIAVDEEGLNVVTVHYTYVTETYKNGKTNSTYTTLKKIIDNPDRIWVNGGKENAYKVQCTGVAISLNDFIAKDGTKVAAIQNSGGFCAFVNELCKPEERNTFSTDMLITKVTHTDADPEKHIDSDYTTVSGCIFGYGPVILPVSFVVRNAQGMKYFEDLDASASNPVFTKVWGRINCRTITFTQTEESAFGEAAVQTSERKSREYVITGTAKVPYDFGDEDVLTAEDVKTMSQNRQVLLAEVENRFNNKPATTSATGPAAVVPNGDFDF